MNVSHITLRQFLLNEAKLHGLDLDLVLLLEDLATTCRIVSHQVRRGALFQNLGAMSSTNIQGETQKKLDVIANDAFINHCTNCSRVAALISEEVDEVIWIKENPRKGDYLIYFDPLDGSSNLDVNLSVGSIFSIIELKEDIDQTNETQVLRKGSEQICAGYSLYGPSISFVFTFGQGVNGFTHQTGTGEFRLTYPDLRIPEDTSEFAINASRYKLWDDPVRLYFEDLIAGKDGPRGRPFNMRWIASMVAEIHRILVRGGVFLYPVDSNNRELGGRLRLLYEVSPMAFIIEQAGGKASTGTERILDIEPKTLHQRSPVILGSKTEVEMAESYFK
ncbi:class 1 fructose-bisphosphatase [Cohaesibacter celericrescens]|uniref:Fructose-1,6-bisphosphatase class 1 n=1 Tax=Cohaesibacter celericrescens TaxID=2067669 RepID=A0A2N5XPP1_9HYPH|nr:class 1 fructose-bisphosphatase [Cohaesibacter celericrescens]PLW76445.1 class 1 fructose-bisphosphatase [Cohaesibacter celericrescens]